LVSRLQPAFVSEKGEGRLKAGHRTVWCPGFSRRL